MDLFPDATNSMKSLLLSLTLVALCGLCLASYGPQAEMQTSITQQYCSFFANRAPAAQPALKNCTWYKENSCCLQREIDATFNKVKPLQGASRQCQIYMNFLMCYICAPDQNLFYSRGRLTVCNDFCDKFYEACSTAILKGYVISELYSNGHDFCKSRRYVVGSNQDIRCFRYSTFIAKGSAGSTRYNALALLAALVAYVMTSGLRLGDVTLGRRSYWLVFVVAVATVMETVMADTRVDEMAKKITDDLTSIARRGLRSDVLQDLYDQAEYRHETINATDRVAKMREKLVLFFSEKAHLASDLARAASEAFDRFHGTYEKPLARSLDGLGTMFMDSDFMWGTGYNLTKNSRFPGMLIHESRSSVKLAPEVSRHDRGLVQTVQWTYDLESVMRRNFLADSHIRWQYFGSVAGVYRQFPGSPTPLNFVGFPLDYDARVRPWYIAATSEPKDVVLILDASFTMQLRGGLEIMKQTATTLVETLSVRDHLSVLVSRSTYWTMDGIEKPYQVETLGCHKRRLVPVTNYLKEELQDDIDQLEGEGGADHGAAFTEAVALLNSTESRSCHKLIIFLTNAVKSHYTIRCDKGQWKYNTGNQLRHQPGYLCLFRPKTLTKLLRNIVGSLQVKMFTLLTSEAEWRTPQLGRELSCLPRNTVLPILPDQDVHQQLHLYYNYINTLTPATATSDATSSSVTSYGTSSATYKNLTLPVPSSDVVTASNYGVVWTSPYVSSDGLGLMLTAAKAVYSSKNAKRLGVVGVDASLASVHSLLEGERWKSAYGFLLDQRGTAVIHPHLDQLGQKVDHSATFRQGNIVDLETHSGKPKDFHKALSAMLSGRTGDIRLENDTYTILTSENNLYWARTDFTHYFYTPIPGTDFFYVLRLNYGDWELRRLTEVSEFRPSYVDDLAGYMSLDPVKYSSLMGIERNSSRYDCLTVALSTSVVKLSPRCFCTSLASPDTGPRTDLSLLHQLLNSRDTGPDTDTGCVQRTLTRKCRADVQLTSLVDEAWRSPVPAGGNPDPGGDPGRDPGEELRVLWTYVGLASGVMRILPGVHFDANYDPVSRPWYTSAVVNVGRLTVSSPYLDASGAGKVVTLSKTITDGANSTCGEVDADCPRPTIRGVVALDLTYADFYSRIVKLTGEECRCLGQQCQSRCLLVDDLGDLVLDSRFLSMADLEQSRYEKVSLSGLHGGIFQTLLRLGVFRKQRRLDYQATCQLRDGIWQPWQSPLKPPVSGNVTLGPLPAFKLRTRCVVEVIYYTTNWTVVSRAGSFVGVLDADPCSRGQYRFSHVPGTNLFLLVLHTFQHRASSFFNFNCHISNSVNRPGRFRVLEKLCSETRHVTTPRGRVTCPRMPDDVMGPFTCSRAAWNRASGVLLVLVITVISL